MFTLMIYSWALSSEVDEDKFSIITNELAIHVFSLRDVHAGIFLIKKSYNKCFIYVCTKKKSRHEKLRK